LKDPAHQHAGSHEEIAAPNRNTSRRSCKIQGRKLTI
jgi:hypothetical protein